MKAIWNGTVIAQSDETIVVENNHYFPPGSVKSEYLQDSETQTSCPWKGISHYKNLVLDGKLSNDAAWFYPEPKEAAERLGIKNYFAFWGGVEITD
jgi:uncharacterized protein (DUF427 family)